MNCRVAASKRASFTDCFSWGTWPAPFLPGPPVPLRADFFPNKRVDDATLTDDDAKARDLVGPNASMELPMASRPITANDAYFLEDRKDMVITVVFIMYTVRLLW